MDISNIEAGKVPLPSYPGSSEPLQLPPVRSDPLKPASPKTLRTLNPYEPCYASIMIVSGSAA